MRQQQGGAFIGRKATRKTQRQGFWIKQRPRRQDLDRVALLFMPQLAGLLTHKVKEFVFEANMHPPQFVVRNIRNTLPQAEFVTRGGPVWSDMFGKQLVQFGRNPGRDMDAIGDSGNRHVGQPQATRAATWRAKPHHEFG